MTKKSERPSRKMVEEHPEASILWYSSSQKDQKQMEDFFRIKLRREKRIAPYNAGNIKMYKDMLAKHNKNAQILRAARKRKSKLARKSRIP